MLAEVCNKVVKWTTEQRTDKEKNNLILLKTTKSLFYWTVERATVEWEKCKGKLCKAKILYRYFKG